MIIEVLLGIALILGGTAAGLLIHACRHIMHLENRLEYSRRWED